MENVDINEMSQSKGLKSIFRDDPVIWSVFFILCAISIIAIFSASSTLVYKTGNMWGPVLKQIGFLCVGLVLIALMREVPSKYYSLFIFLLLVSIILLILTLCVGEKKNGADRWLTIGGLSFQPSEIAKISLMGTIAFLLSKQNEENEKVLFYWMMGLVFVICGLIAIDNLSTALLLFGFCAFLMFIGHVKSERWWEMLGIAAIIVLVCWSFATILPSKSIEKTPLKRFDTWQARVKKYRQEGEMSEEDYFKITDDNYQVAHAKMAIANGGVIGRFPGNSKERDFLPQAYSDFIYAIILEEMGLVGGIFVMLMYIIILIRAGIVAKRTNLLFPKYLILGSALMLVMQAFVNMAVAVNLIPVTGQPLPLISRGGTSTIITCAYFGLILSAERFGYHKAKDSVTTEEANVGAETTDLVGQEVENTPFVVSMAETANSSFADESAKHIVPNFGGPTLKDEEELFFADESTVGMEPRSEMAFSLSNKTVANKGSNKIVDNSSTFNVTVKDNVVNMYDADKKNVGSDSTYGFNMSQTSMFVSDWITEEDIYGDSK